MEIKEEQRIAQSAPPAGGANTFTVSIRGGLHDGTSITLAEGVHEISTQPQSALCLQDAKLDGPKALVLYKGRAALVQSHDVTESLQTQRVPSQFPLGEASLEITSNGSRSLLAMCHFSKLMSVACLE